MAADVNLPLRRAAERLTLQDLWNWYLRPSLFGREVITLGGGSTESRAFFIPFVSAMQLYAYDHVPASRHPGRKRCAPLSSVICFHENQHLRFKTKNKCFLAPVCRPAAPCVCALCVASVQLCIVWEGQVLSCCER